MSQASRRAFLAVAGSGAVTTAVVAAAPSSQAASSSSSASSTTSTQPLVAHVQDAAAGTVVLYVGHDEVVVHDHELVARLTRAARR